MRTRDPVDSGSGMGKKSGSRSKMNNPDHISESLETIFWVKMRIRDPGWKNFGSGIRDGKNSDPGYLSLYHLLRAKKSFSKYFVNVLLRQIKI
jgi:hypothetical protein